MSRVILLALACVAVIGSNRAAWGDPGRALPQPAADVAYDGVDGLRAGPNGFHTRLAFGSEERGATLRRLAREVAARHGGRRLWVPASGANERTLTLLAALAAAADHGLEPHHYDAAGLADAVDRIPRDAADDDAFRDALDRALTEALVLYAADLRRGRLAPEDYDWFVRRDALDLEDTLVAVLDADDFDAALERLAPPFPAYDRLRQRLRAYRLVDAEGGWPVVADGPNLAPGDAADRRRLAALERRLRAEGDLDDGRAEHEIHGDGSVEGLFDERLAAGVRRFQRRHGIAVDGVVGPMTMRALNTAASDRIRQLEANLERWRWMPRDLESRRIEVNIPSFELTLTGGDFDAGADMRMAVVIGRPNWPTPVFSDEVRFIVTNPYWNVPQSIARVDIVPKTQRDPTYLEREGYIVTDARGQPMELDEDELGRLSHRRHFFRQLPGPNNALGRMKFMFPNEFNVYLHDTPSRHLFARPARAYSHGCIRVERPFDLARYLVQGDPEWSMARVERLLERGGADRWIRLHEGVPIYIVYFTATADAGGEVRLHPDLYRRDERLGEGLRRDAELRAPTASEAHVARAPAGPAVTLR